MTQVKAFKTKGSPGCGDQYGVLIVAVPNLPGNASNQKGTMLMPIMKDKFRA